MRDNQQLSDHFSLYELTVTSNAALQDENRDITDDQVLKLKILAAHGEKIRELCGNQALRVHSGYRCLKLNGDTSGSSSTSQHPRCEALDFDIIGESIEDTFNTLLGVARADKFKFGQLIIEQANRGGEVVKWVHCSVIGTLAPEKVGMIMKMSAGDDGEPHYQLIEQIKMEEITS